MEHRRRVSEVMRALERGGPCLIKLGQWASTRPDLLPLTTCRTLASLHDAVPSHSHRATLAAIEEAFGAPWDKIFKRVCESGWLWLHCTGP